jgi:hypothetical protein
VKGGGGTEGMREVKGAAMEASPGRTTGSVASSSPAMGSASLLPPSVESNTLPCLRFAAMA